MSLTVCSTRLHLFDQKFCKLFKNCATYFSYDELTNQHPEMDLIYKYVLTILISSITCQMWRKFILGVNSPNWLNLKPTAWQQVFAVAMDGD